MFFGKIISKNNLKDTTRKVRHKFTVYVQHIANTKMAYVKNKIEDINAKTNNQQISFKCKKVEIVQSNEVYYKLLIIKYYIMIPCNVLADKYISV